MRITIETLRFIFIVYLLSMVCGVIANLTFSRIGLYPENYSWTVVVGVLILLFLLYKKMGWGKDFNKTILWTSVAFVVLLALLIPDNSPTYLHTTNYSYSYGFPFPFLTLHVENGSAFFIPNLISGGVIGWTAGIGLFGNFLLYYFLYISLLKFSKINLKRL
ncbi:hypothetical protein [Sediminibacillus halophilus]|uniref:Uncharacterized protein n=1 Tax=Sediminibacillus halophilus TaxID=482461 RepID=A0A1G9REL1_9BACI|nr:hypothetical protein [Sediminibacillus halophilus]SDM21759.1 hypothetical protein SAMN05216244_1960 [Sediminibacillus halophilus]